MRRKQKFNIVSQQEHEKENGILSNFEGKVLCHWRTNYCRILLFTGIVLHFTARRQHKLKKMSCNVSDLSFQFSRALSGKLHWTTLLSPALFSICREWRGENTDTMGMGSEGQHNTLLLKFLCASDHSIIVCIFQYIPGGKAVETVDCREDHLIRCWWDTFQAKQILSTASPNT